MSGSGTGIRGNGQVVPALLALFLGWALPADAQAIKVGSFAKSTGVAPVTQTVNHGLGQTPKALILWTDGKINENFTDSFRYAFGMTDGTTSKSVAIASQNGQAASNASRRLADKALAIVQWGERLAGGGGPAVLGRHELHPQLDDQQRDRLRRALHRDRRPDGLGEGRELADGHRHGQPDRHGRWLHSRTSSCMPTSARTSRRRPAATPPTRTSASG